MIASAKATRSRVVTSRRLDEKRHESLLACGMKLVFLPRRGFDKKLAFVVSDYGSLDREWKNHGRHVVVPDGIAHFLEHQLFKKQRGDMTDEFSRRGAYTNAHTSHTMTAFYFECVERFEENLATLLEMTLTSWFDAQLVNTERDIIIQEINQYRDNPNWVGYQQLLETLYLKYPLRVDIAGTAQTVAAITPELLELCHTTFYHPTNLTLIVSGDFEPRALRKLADDLASRFAPVSPAPRIERIRPTEPEDTSVRAERRMTLARPRLLLGFKDLKPRRGKDLLHAELATALALDCLFSRESEAYERMYGQGLIGGDFTAAFQAEAGFGYAILGGETKEPAALEQHLWQTLEQAGARGLDAAVLERKKRKFLGRYLRNFNDPESTAYSYLSALGQKSDLFDFPAVLEQVTVGDVDERVRNLFERRRSAASLLLPMA
ncbi:insulinase family protein [bacterium]|nr:MAG: insulinase family protein [bacterium]RIK61879.1 MAG: hypothetical protein DCC64_11975 [Planctomycetota bacterium]